MTSPKETQYSSSISEKSTYPTSIAILRWIGYVMLLLFLMDVATLLYPAEFMNPNWEFQTAGNIVERIVIPLMGLGFIFFGEDKFRNPLDMLMMKILSWISLLTGVIFIVILPLVIVTSAQRIAIQIDDEFGSQYQQQLSQSATLQQQIETASASDLESLIANQATDSDITSPESARQELLANLDQARQQLQIQVTGEINQRKTLVKKNATKWIVGSFVSGTLLAYIWRLTQWARIFPTGNIFRRAKKAGL